MPAVRARILALLAALVMLLPSGASARTEYYCRMMGRIVASSACDEHAAKVSRPVSALRAEDCCQRITSASRSAVPGTREAVRDVAHAALATAVSRGFVVGLRGERGSVCAETTQAPLAIGPPLFIVHCALLS